MDKTLALCSTTCSSCISSYYQLWQVDIGCYGDSPVSSTKPGPSLQVHRSACHMLWQGTQEWPHWISRTEWSTTQRLTKWTLTLSTQYTPHTLHPTLIDLRKARRSTQTYSHTKVMLAYQQHLHFCLNIYQKTNKQNFELCKIESMMLIL